MTLEKIKMEIAGEISLSEDPGATMRKWREIFEITQVELARYLGITVSTISDYEGNRRKSPGTHVIKRFVNSLFEIDKGKGGNITQKFTEKEKPLNEYFEVHEFARSISLKDFVDIIDGKVLTNPDIIETKKIYGYTLIDSIKVILDMPFSYFQNLYGNVNERVFIFTGISTGRSPFVVVRVSSAKPSAIVLHNINPNKVDRLAVKISERERIPMIVTKKSLEDIKEALNRI
ncbi:helix-turn-helix domain-containing protein [Candidatus Micrarchaeota archaeon]|nr:helix-turn-helix domain-containing protein [Candidatus Micrarchaeota archaeon]MBU1165467.1 helix-turn-helix domain-containing protein [Candidatus Micrarchaeota archaeon]MBU1887448.1 helix-turn-helix domain-containing protein [Candidatus Micrarchaeota archaeon]